MGRLLVLSAFVMLGRLSYGVSFPDLHYRAADCVDKIIKGVRPEDLPVQLPTKFEPDQRIFPESHRGACPLHDRSSNESTFHLPLSQRPDLTVQNLHPIPVELSHDEAIEALVVGAAIVPQQPERLLLADEQAADAVEAPWSAARSFAARFSPRSTQGPEKPGCRVYGRRVAGSGRLDRTDRRDFRCGKQRGDNGGFH